MAEYIQHLLQMKAAAKGFVELDDMDMLDETEFTIDLSDLGNIQDLAGAARGPLKKRKDNGGAQQQHKHKRRVHLAQQCRRGSRHQHPM